MFNSSSIFKSSKNKLVQGILRNSYYDILMIIIRQGCFNKGVTTFSVMTLSIKYSGENFEEKGKN
jgi:hypothetical protein